MQVLDGIAFSCIPSPVVCTVYNLKAITHNNVSDFDDDVFHSYIYLVCQNVAL